METIISRRDRRTALIGMGVIGGLLALARGTPALVTWSAAERAAERDASVQLSLARRDAERLPALRREAAEMRQTLARRDSTLLVGASAAEIIAALADTVEDAADDAQLDVATVQLRADSARGALAQVVVRITGETDVRGLVAFLRAVDESPVPLVVRDLGVTAADPSGPDTKPEVLRIELSVETVARMSTRS